MPIRTKILAPLAAALMLAGCSGEPSESNMKDAMVSKLAVVFGTQGQSVDEMKARLAVEKGDCVEASGEPGWICDVRVGQTVNGQKQFPTPWGKGRFFKVNGNWAFEERR